MLRVPVSLLPGFLLSLSLFSSVSIAEAPGAAPVRIGGIEPGGSYFQPITPEIVVSEGYTVAAQELDGQPYDGSQITEHGLHSLRVTVVDAQGNQASTHVRFFVLSETDRAPIYTTDMVRYHVQRLAEHPDVMPTRSADQRMVIGRSPGWAQDPEVPEHEVYGFQVADRQGDGAKVSIVLVGGNHPREQTGSWALQGALDFLLSEDPRAEQLRGWCTFFVYPMVNPDGRYAFSGRSNPEMQAEKVTDHNRVWNTTGRFSTIDIVTGAIKADTAGTVHYLLDFHSAGATFFFTGPELMASSYAQAMTAREPEIKPRRSEGHPGMIRNWAMSSEGLNVPFAYTPELAGAENVKRSLDVGRSFMLAFHDLITGSAPLAAADQALQTADDTPLSDRHRQRIPERKAGLQQVLADKDASVHQILADVDALYDAINDYREAQDVASEIDRLHESVQQSIERSPLEIATWLHEQLNQQMRQLTESQSDPGADLAQIRSQTRHVTHLRDTLQQAESSERAVSESKEILGTPFVGFGQVYQNRVRHQRERLVELLDTPGTSDDQFVQATADLQASIKDGWQVHAQQPFPAVRAGSLGRENALLETVSQADWADGLLINVLAEQDGLAPVARPTLRFRGDGDHVQTEFVPDETTLGQQFTWEFWKRYRVFQDATGASGNRGTPPRFYTQLAGDQGQFRTAIGDAYWTSTTLETPDTWYHIAIVFDKGQVRTYVDGELLDTREEVVFSGDGSSPFAIGQGFQQQRWLDGSTREHRIWKVARSQTEIQRDKHRRLESQQPGLVGYWRLDEGQGETAFDGSASENHGIIVGAVWETQAEPGFRIAQPLELGQGIQAADVTVSWEVHLDDQQASCQVAVSYGTSEDEATFPASWMAATNGDVLHVPDEATPGTGRYLWLKQVLTPDESTTSVRLRRMTVQIR
jgi:hypothetical protein